MSVLTVFFDHFTGRALRMIGSILLDSLSSILNSSDLEISNDYRFRFGTTAKQEKTKKLTKYYSIIKKSKTFNQLRFCKKINMCLEFSQ